MNDYEITLNSKENPIIMRAEFYECRDGFIHLFKTTIMAGGPEPFASYAFTDVRRIVLQEKTREAE